MKKNLKNTKLSLQKETVKDLNLNKIKGGLTSFGIWATIVAGEIIIAATVTISYKLECTGGSPPPPEPKPAPKN